ILFLRVRCLLPTGRNRRQNNVRPDQCTTNRSTHRDLPPFADVPKLWQAGSSPAYTSLGYRPKTILKLTETYYVYRCYNIWRPIAFIDNLADSISAGIPIGTDGNRSRPTPGSEPSAASLCMSLHKLHNDFEGKSIATY